MLVMLIPVPVVSILPSCLIDTLPVLPGPSAVSMPMALGPDPVIWVPAAVVTLMLPAPSTTLATIPRAPPVAVTVMLPPVMSTVTSPEVDWASMPARNGLSASPIVALDDTTTLPVLASAWMPNTSPPPVLMMLVSDTVALILPAPESTNMSRPMPLSAATEMTPGPSATV